MRLLVLLTLTNILLPKAIMATTYVLPTWEHLATTSEFIGVVECVTAGGIVARYRVIDSWKGSPVGTVVNISQHVDVFEPQFPISLVGERFFLFGEKSASYRITSFTAGGGVPLWWRNIPTDLRCFSLIPLKDSFGRYLNSYMGARTAGLVEFKAEVLSFLHSGAEEQELRLMLAAARKNLHLPDPLNPTDKGNEEDIKLYETLNGAETVDELWKTAIECASELIVAAIPKTAAERRSQKHKFTLLSMLSDGGRGLCKALWEKADLPTLPWEKQEVDRALSQIRRNLAPPEDRPGWLDESNSKFRQNPTQDEIIKAEVLLSEPWNYQTGPAFELLCRHAPALAVPFLLAWQPSKDRRDQHFGYLLGSAFGHLCAFDRKRLFDDLLLARDPWIRVSAAVYLCFEDLKQGEKALRALAVLEGDPGSWAALVLASRGDKTAMMRALEVMANPHDGQVLTGNRGNLQKRLRVLLSNVASRSGVPQPPASPKEVPEWGERSVIQKQWHEALVAWWRENEARITLVDPWAKLLEEQKVD